MERFLLPKLEAHAAKLGKTHLSCLQIQPDDEDEANHLRFLGHSCAVVITAPDRFRNQTWSRTPVIADPFALPFSDHRFDLIFTGALSLIGPVRDLRSAAIGEWSRICAPGGALLFSIGNRWCPVDLASREDRIHTPWHPAKASLKELQTALARPGRFATVARLSLKQHFGLSSVPPGLSFLKHATRSYLGWASNPQRPAIYASTLNPVLMLWAERSFTTD